MFELESVDMGVGALQFVREDEDTVLVVRSA